MEHHCQILWLCRLRKASWQLICLMNNFVWVLYSDCICTFYHKCCIVFQIIAAFVSQMRDSCLLLKYLFNRMDIVMNQDGCHKHSVKQMKQNLCSYLKVQSWKLHNNKYMITSTQINTEIFSFVAAPDFKLLSRKVLFINRKDNKNS